MFHLFKPKNSVLCAPVDGTVVSLDDVPDPVFSQRMMGDGVAIQADGEYVYAPADGMITVTIEDKHAFGMCLENGMDLIVHVGLDTTGNPEAYEMLVEEHQQVKAGTPVLRIHRELLKDRNLLTPVIITNPECFTLEIAPIGEHVVGGQSTLITYH